MFTKFQVDRTSTSSKTISTKNFNQNFNLKRDERTDKRMKEQTDAQTRKHNAHKWSIKILTVEYS